MNNTQFWKSFLSLVGNKMKKLKDDISRTQFFMECDISPEFIPEEYANEKSSTEQSSVASKFIFQRLGQVPPALARINSPFRHRVLEMFKIASFLFADEFSVVLEPLIKIFDRPHSIYVPERVNTLIGQVFQKMEATYAFYDLKDEDSEYLSIEKCRSKGFPIPKPSPMYLSMHINRTGKDNRFVKDFYDKISEGISHIDFHYTFEDEHNYTTICCMNDEGKKRAEEYLNRFIENYPEFIVDVDVKISYITKVVWE